MYLPVQWGQLLSLFNSNLLPIVWNNIRMSLYTLNPLGYLPEREEHVIDEPEDSGRYTEKNRGFTNLLQQCEVRRELLYTY